jgi:PAS domain S-box-containing protein
MITEDFPYKILIVEDEAIIARDIAARLTKLGYIVTGTASSSEQTLKLIEENKPDLILMDIVIKGQHDGIECSYIVNEKYSIPVVFLTAHSDHDTIERTKFTNPYGFISKPVDERDLNINIRNAMYRYDAERKLKDFKEKYYRLAENSRDLIFRYSLLYNKFEYINSACFDITGYSQKEFYDTPTLYNLYFRNEDPLPRSDDLNHIDSEYSVFDKDNNKKWVKQSAILFRDSHGEPYAVEGILYDVTEKVLNEQKMKLANEKLHALADHLNSIRENERLEISRELHDQLGQDMTGLKLTLASLVKKLSNRDSEIDRNLFENEMRMAIGKIDEVFSYMRRLTTDMRPNVLERFGLIEAVNWHIETFSMKTGINCEVNISGNDLLVDRKAGLSIYRLVQELLTNVARHAGALNAVISLKFNDQGISVTVADDGVGIDLLKIEDSKSLGIIGMQERVFQLNGTITFLRLEPKGTECRINIPLNAVKVK